MSTIASAVPVSSGAVKVSSNVVDALTRSVFEMKDVAQVSLIDFFDELGLFIKAPPMESVGYRVAEGEQFFESWETKYAEPALKSIGINVLRWEGGVSKDNDRYAVIQVNSTTYHLVY